MNEMRADLQLTVSYRAHPALVARIAEIHSNIQSHTTIGSTLVVVEDWIVCVV